MLHALIHSLPRSPDELGCEGRPERHRLRCRTADLCELYACGGEDAGSSAATTTTACRSTAR